jgi:hypothetical protein
LNFADLGFGRAVAAATGFNRTDRTVTIERIFSARIAARLLSRRSCSTRIRIASPIRRIDTASGTHACCASKPIARLRISGQASPRIRK